MDQHNEIQIEKLRTYRRELHQIPEQGFREYKTRAYLLKILEQFTCLIEDVAGTGLCAVFRAVKPQMEGAVAFRSDMDGLPTEEQNDVSYRSTHPNMMHACGHDGHMAMLLGLAFELNALGDELPCDVLLLFQPAEEGPGGAELVLESGILDRYAVQSIFALHLGPSELAGSVATRPGPFMARSSELDITIHGRSAHCSAAHKGIDALLIGCRLVSEIYKREATALPIEEFHLLKFGHMESGIVRNAISDRTAIYGTLRCFNDEVFSTLLDQIKQAATSLEEEYGCTIEISHTEGYPPTINDPALFEMAKKSLADIPFITLRKPSMASDDFSFYSQKLPALNLFLGTGNRTPLHSAVFDFDEAVLYDGVEIYLALLSGAVSMNQD